MINTNTNTRVHRSHFWRLPNKAKSTEPPANKSQACPPQRFFSSFLFSLFPINWNSPRVLCEVYVLGSAGRHKAGVPPPSTRVPHLYHSEWSKVQSVENKIPKIKLQKKLKDGASEKKTRWWREKVLRWTMKLKSTGRRRGELSPKEPEVVSLPKMIHFTFNLWPQTSMMILHSSPGSLFFCLNYVK